jgi:YD repeat-containing protein
MKSNKSRVFVVGVTLLMLSAFSVVYADDITVEKIDDASGLDADASNAPDDSLSSDSGISGTPAGSDSSEDTINAPVSTVPMSEPVVPDSSSSTTSASDNLYYKLTSVSSPKGTFGEMSGFFQTSMFTGSASYVYPLTLPKGTNGLTPEVLLSYDSGSANGRAGIVGLGWDLGLSYVERDVNYTPDNLNDDKFILVLGGQRNDLVYVSADNRFHTKIESYLHVNKSSGGSNLKGEYWIARTKDGTEYQFGYYSGSGYNSEALCSNGFYVHRWYLDRVKDTHNNTLLFYYAQNASAKDVGAVYPSKITYNGPLTSANKTIDFILENSDRKDIPIVYEQGCRVSESRRVGEIKISFNNTLIRKYLLKYSLNYANSKSILSSITECGNDNTSCLPSTSFENVGSDYQFDTSGVTWSFPSSLGSSYPRLIETWSGDYSAGSKTTRDVFDINGDGLPEVVDVPISGSYWNVFQNLGNGFNTSSVRWYTPGNVFIRYQNTSRGDTTADTFDINGDGLPDYVKVANGHWEIYYNNGTGFSSASFNWSTPGTILIRDLNDNYDTTSDTFDINGDGLPEFVKTATNHWDVYFNNRSGFNSTAYYWSFPNSASNIRVANGDGDMENDTFDINGDGLPDYVTKKSDHWNVYLNNGTGFNASALYWSFPSGTVSSTHIRFLGIDGNVGRDTIDINGDGLPDHVDAKGSHWDVYFNNGSGFNITAFNWPAPTMENPNLRITGNISDITYIAWDTFDVNGDGLPDYVDHYQDANWKVYLNTVKSPDRLGKITNSLGGNTTVSYMSSTRFSNTGSDNVSDLGFPIWVVNSTIENNSMNGIHNIFITYNYSYAGGLYSYTDHEFRGFGYVNVTNSLGNYDSYRFYQDDSRKGRLRSVYSFDKNGAYYFGTENNWTNSNKSGGYYEVLLAGTTDYTFDGFSANPKSSEVHYSYDSYGNLVKGSYLGSNISGDERYVANTYVVNTNKWIVNRASNTSLSDSGNNVLARTEYYYDNSTSLTAAPGLGDVTKERHLVNGSYVETLYGYYSNGALRNSTDSEGRSSYFEYDNTYAFPKRTINAKGQSTNYTYDPGTGNLLNLTDANGFMTYFLYDVFGRVVKEVRHGDSISNPSVLYNYSLDGIAPEGVKVSKRTDSDTLDVYQFVEGFGRLIQIRRESEDSSRQIVENSLYDSLGRVEKQLIPYNETSSTSYANPPAGIKYVQYSYDPIGRVNKTTNTDGNYSTGSYDHWNITVRDENGHQTNYYLDAYKRVYKVEERNSGEVYSTTYNYSIRDELVKITDSKGNVFSFGFDELGRKINMTDPDMGIWLYVYDKVGNLKTQRDNRNNLTSFGYDVLNRVTSVNYSDGKKIVYVYDKDSPYSDGVLGTLAYVSEAGDRSTRYYYDARLRNVKEVRMIAGNTWTMNWTYDSADRINSTRYPENSLYSFAYNSQGSLNNISNAISNIDYSSQDKVIKKQFPNGVNTTFIYDPNSFRLISIWTLKSTTYQSLNFTYDQVGNIKAINDEGAVQNFSYDDLDRLTSSLGQNYNQSYIYDPIGNMISLIDNGNVTLFGYGAGISSGAGPHAMNISLTATTTTTTATTSTLASSGSLVFNSTSISLIDSGMAMVYPDTNYGSVEAFEIAVWDDSSNYQRGLFSFTLPYSGGYVDNVTLQFYVFESYNGGVNEYNISAYSLSKTWNESQVTFNKNDSISAWSTAGGDYNAVEIASYRRMNNLGFYNLTLKGRNAKNPLNITWGSTVNLIVKPVNDSLEQGIFYSYSKIYSKESANISLRPRIQVDYTSTTSVSTTSTTVSTTTTTLPSSGSLVFNSTSISLIDSGMAMVYPDTNYGSVEAFEIAVWDDGSNYQRGLFRFTLPSGSGFVDNVTLQFYVFESYNGGVNEYNISAYSLTKTWGESQVTFNKNDSSTNWSTAGGDYSAVEIASYRRMNNLGFYNLTLKGRNAKNPLNLTWGSTVNIIVKPVNDSLNQGIYYSYSTIYSKESANISLRPRVKVDYTSTTTTTTTSTTSPTTTTPTTTTPTTTLCDTWAYDNNPQNCYIDLAELITAYYDWLNDILPLNCYVLIQNAYIEDTQNPACQDKSASSPRTISSADRSFAVTLVCPADQGSFSDRRPVFSFRVAGYTFLYNCSIYVNGSLRANTWAKNNTDRPLTLSKDLEPGKIDWYVSCSDYSIKSNVSSSRSVIIEDALDSSASISVPSLVTTTSTSTTKLSTTSTTKVAPVSDTTQIKSESTTTTARTSTTTSTTTTSSQVSSKSESLSTSISPRMISASENMSITTSSFENTTSTTVLSLKCWNADNKYLYENSAQYKKFCKCVSGVYDYNETSQLSLDDSAYGYVDPEDNGNWAVNNQSSGSPVYQVKCSDTGWYLTNQTYYAEVVE